MTDSRLPDGAASGPPPGLGRGRLALYSILALLLILAAYSNHFTNGFHEDDFAVIEGNLYLRSLKNIPRFFRQSSTYSTAPSAAHYRPLASVSFALDYAWGGGLNLVAFHTTQLALHLLTTLLVGLLARRLLRRCGASAWADPLALFGMVFFGVHLVQTEIVNLLVLRSEIISTLGALGSLYAYECAPRWRRTGVWLIPMALGALAKPPALMLAPLLACYLALLPPPEADGAPAAPATRIRHGLAAFAAAAALYILQDRMGGPLMAYGFLPRGVYFQTQIYSWLHYLRLFVLPLGLTVDFDFPPIDYWFDTRICIAALFCGLLLVIALAWAAARPRTGRLFLFGTLWFFIALAPSSSLIPIPDMACAYRAYFAYIGLTLCVLALATRLLDWARRTGRTRWQSGLALAGVALIGMHAAATYRRNRDWRDEKTLWQSALRATPENARAWAAVGFIHLQDGQYAEARRCLEMSLKLRPGQHLPLMQLGGLELMEGHLAQAEADYLRAIAMAPNQADIYIAYSGVLDREHRAPEAVAALEKAFALAPANLAVRRILLGKYLALGDTAKFCRLGGDTQDLVEDRDLARELTARCPKGSGP
jgi:tetratricopeptide (TPR) repeat protein